MEFVSLGRWWGNDSIEKSQAEIDIIAGQDKTAAIFGECKWMNEKADLSVLETLEKRSNLFPYRKKYFYVFSRSGFTKGCMDRAKEMGNAALVSYREIVKAMNGSRF